MSFKGFKKAVERLPYVLQAKTGNTDETIDPEFQALEAQILELEELTSRLLDAAKKYKDAIASMLEHQESLGKVMQELYEPIAGRFVSSDSINSGLVSKKARPGTPEQTLKSAQEFHVSSQSIAELVVPKLDLIIERQVIQPANDYANLHKILRKTLVKRDHKRIDYDRHKLTLKKAKEKVADREDERKIVKLQDTVDAAFREYETINNLLKTQLPVYIKLRIGFIDPLTEALFMFQDLFYATLFSKMDVLRSFVDMSVDISAGYQSRVGEGLALLDEIETLKGLTIKSPMPPISPQSPDSLQEFDADPNYGPSKPARLSAPGLPPYSQASEPPVKTGVIQPKPLYAPAYAPAVVQKKPPPPAPKPTHLSLIPAKPLATALHDFEALQQGDLDLKQGDLIEILESSNDPNTWWTGRCQRTNQVGAFPGNYVRL